MKNSLYTQELQAQAADIQNYIAAMQVRMKLSAGSYMAPILKRKIKERKQELAEVRQAIKAAKA